VKKPFILTNEHRGKKGKKRHVLTVINVIYFMVKDREGMERKWMEGYIIKLSERSLRPG
jgi:hypothetical protein